MKLIQLKLFHLFKNCISDLFGYDFVKTVLNVEIFNRRKVFKKNTKGITGSHPQSKNRVRDFYDRNRKTIDQLKQRPSEKIVLKYYVLILISRKTNDYQTLLINY